MAALPSREDCVLPCAIARSAQRRPDDLAVLFDDERVWTNAECHRATLRAAAGLHALGVRAGDRVLCWLPNGPDALRSWFGANQLGAVHVPINTAYRGALLGHVVANADARVAVVHGELLPRLAELGPGSLTDVVVTGPPARGFRGAPFRVHQAEVLETAGIPDAIRECPAQPWDPYAILYTSGTTGPSKGVLSSYLHAWATTSCFPLAADDRFLVNLPLFHAGGAVDVLGTLVQGGSVVLAGGFDTDTFWALIRRTGTTSCVLLGVMANFLLNRPASPRDADNPLRTVYLVPLTEDGAIFGKRFGCDIYTVFNMSEISSPLLSDANPSVVGSCGRPRDGVRVRLVDEHDIEVPPGEVGELVIRTELPHTLNSGYWRDPEATAAAWRNGWFHTGDAFRIGETGDYFFVDRMKDAIRRRGENISSFEVEAEILAHPAVREAAVVGVPSDHGEEDVLAVVAPVEDADFDPAELITFLRDRLAHFMVPRYVRILPALPKTPTSKVRKHVLRGTGVTADTWDRELAGMHVRREHLGR
ncbi:AMP-binding protein [Amycolatopsis anabasis]|uniref:AMP-binding protein n=1 Tax=Amycolatopsis anabasis TaxID=1840409 RepID=UPI001C554733|nr:AMP-binding protein [Amycolatopsis anabasis]